VVKRHDVTRIPVQQVEPGFTLAIPSEGGQPRRPFQVEEVGWEYKNALGEKAMMVLTSEPLPDTGEPWVLKYPIGTLVTRVMRTYDDGLTPGAGNRCPDVLGWHG